MIATNQFQIPRKENQNFNLMYPELSSADISGFYHENSPSILNFYILGEKWSGISGYFKKPIIEKIIFFIFSFGKNCLGYLEISGIIFPSDLRRLSWRFFFSRPFECESIDLFDIFHYIIYRWTRQRYTVKNKLS